MKRFCLVVVALGAFCGSYAADWIAYRLYAPDPKAIERVVNSDLTLLSEDVSYTTEVAAPNDREVRSLGCAMK